MTNQSKITKDPPSSCRKIIAAGNAHLKNLRILNDQLSSQTFINDQERELILPLKSFRHFSSRPILIGEKKREEFFLIITQAFVFLREMEGQLFELGAKIPDCASQLAILEEETSIIKGMMRQALSQFDVMVKSIEEPFELCRNDFPESIDERQGNGTQHHDKDSLGDISPVKPCQEVPHGGEDNQ